MSSPADRLAEAACCAHLRIVYAPEDVTVEGLAGTPQPGKRSRWACEACGMFFALATYRARRG